LERNCALLLPDRGEIHGILDKKGVVGDLFGSDGLGKDPLLVHSLKGLEELLQNNTERVTHDVSDVVLHPQLLELEGFRNVNDSICSFNFSSDLIEEHQPSGSPSWKAGRRCSSPFPNYPAAPRASRVSP